LSQHWKKVLIFALKLKGDSDSDFIIQATITYMASISKTVQQKLQDPATHFSPKESEMVLPYFVSKLLDQGKAEGKAERTLQMLVYFIQSNPTVSDAEIASMFKVEVELVLTARKQAANPN
jgi:hypothetical protein